ncbi:MAG: hypothetical protein LBT89_09840 [Planctomycetaceae bacterium]|jgi:hypothetical protein|nr:hypothetical protein [Planctomycetaceae bacterium]
MTNGKAAFFGRVHRREFRQIFRQHLAEYQRRGTAAVLLTEADAIPAILPDECLFFQSYPNEFSPELLDTLRDVPKKFYLGTCCEGMFRTSKPPVTLENWQYVHGIAHFDAAPEQTTDAVYVVSHFGALGNDAAMNRYLADDWQSLGYRLVRQILPESPPVLLVAAADDSPFPVILESIQSLKAMFADNDYAVYINSPRIAEKTELGKLGVRVISLN